jgi:hypothetical protein
LQFWFAFITLRFDSVATLRFVNWYRLTAREKHSSFHISELVMRIYSVSDSLSLSQETRETSSSPCLGTRSSWHFLILLMLLLLPPMATSPAQWFCASPSTEEVAPLSSCYNSVEKRQHSDTVLLGPIRVALHVVRRSNGTVGGAYNNFSPENLRLSCEDARQIFERDAGLQLQFDTTINYIDSDEIYSTFPVGLGELARPAGVSLVHKSPNTLDVFIADNFAISATLSAYVVPYGSCLISVRHLYDTSVLGAHGRILAHELGHLFGLYHVHEQIHGVEYISRSRLASNGDSLCFSNGDFCCDTPAEPYAYPIFHAVDCSLDTTGSIQYSTDPDGFRYLDAVPSEKPDVTNLMGYGRPNHCMEGFSLEQAMIMRCTYRSWQLQTFVKFVTTNRTANIDNIGGELIVFPPTSQLGQGGWCVVQSGDTLNLLDGANQIRLTARDTISYNDTLYRSLNWGNDRKQTELLLYWNYDTTREESYNNDACTAIFARVSDSVTVLATVDGIEADSVQVLLFDPWTPSISSHSTFHNFPWSRHRFADTWYTDTANYRYYAPFRPDIGVFRNQTAEIGWDHRNSFYRIASPLAIDGITRDIFAPGAGSPIVPGDAFLWQWNSDTVSTEIFSNEEIHSAWRTGSLRFLTEDQRITLAYKGHMLASSRLAWNSQRKLVHDGNRYWMLYDSGDSYWLTSTDDPQSQEWSMEQEVSGLPMGATSCLDARDDLVLATAASGPQWNVALLQAASTDQRQALDIPLAQGDSVAHAVIAKQTGAPFVVAIAERSTSSGQRNLVLALLQAVGGSSDYAFETLTVLPTAMNGIPRNPSLACDETGAFHLVWEEHERIFYTRFLVDASGVIDSVFSLYPDQLPICSILMHGSNPSIAVDAFNRPHVTWESTLHGLDEPGSWSQFEASKFGRVIAHRYKLRPYSNPASAKTWSRETIFAIEGRDGSDPVVGCDRFNPSKIGISWWTEADGGRIHVALAEHNESGIQSWKRRTIDTTGSAPHFVIGRGGIPLMAYTRAGAHFGAVFQELQVTHDQEHVDFALPPTAFPLEFRGALVRNESFTAGVYFRMYEDTLTGDAVDFVPTCDTVHTDIYAQVPNVVRTESVETSHLFFDIHRLVHGITADADPGVFDTATVSWWAVIKNAVNDTVVDVVKLGELARDSLFTCVDSARVSIPFQSVYAELIVEAPITVFPCVQWGSRIGIARNQAEYSTQKSRPSHQPDHPDIATLHAAAPNPFTGKTTLAFTLREIVPVQLSVYDALGRRVAVLLDEPKPAGHHAIEFDGSGLKSGVYYYRLLSGDLSLMRRMHILH